MSSSELALSARGVGKAYVIRHGGEPSSTAAEAITRRVRQPLARQSREDFWALRDLDLDIRRGEVVGVVGRNGAGKSTLLKILARITPPSTGRVDIFGRVGSLLEVGTGFHPELTGRENVFLNGTILGMRRRMVAERFDEIVEFAGVERFLDTPVKRYSSGMYVRLAFAVAAHLDSDILLVDEVLAVGDAGFQRKCLGKIGAVASEGRTVILVSHNAGAIAQLTRHCVLLEGGRVVYDGDTAEALRQLSEAGDLTTNSDDLSTAFRPDTYDQRAVLTAARFENTSRVLMPGEDLSLVVDIHAMEAISAPTLMVMVHRGSGDTVGVTFTDDLPPLDADERCSYAIDLGGLSLSTGSYYLSVAIGHGDDHRGHAHYDLVSRVLHFDAAPPANDDGVGKWHYTWGPVRLDRPTVTPGPPSCR